MSRVREIDVVASNLTAIGFVLQFCYWAEIPCNMGLNIKTMQCPDGGFAVSVVILDLAGKHNLLFRINKIPGEKIWKICCLHPVELDFSPEASNELKSKKLHGKDYFRFRATQAGNIFSFEQL